MSCTELQEEEKEVLLSIYDGDNRFINVSPTIYQYRYGEENGQKSFLLEISWTENYPNEKPNINMDTFYNKHIANNIKEKIVESILSEAEQYLGTAMTYTLFEYVKEKEEEFTNEIPEKVINSEYEIEKSSILKEQENIKTDVEPKKQQLSKAQKRRQWDKVTSKGQKPRGWNWVDLVKHLSQVDHKMVANTEVQSN